jgi:hypothetical protein
MMLRFVSDSFRMGEDLKILAACDRNEGDAARLGKPYSRGRGARDSGNDRRTEPCCLLDKLDRDPARQYHNAM